MKRLDNIQHLRAVAALTVLVSHLIELAWKSAGAGTAPFNLDGRFGVDVFFVISGFIMFHTSARAFGERGATKEFVWRRLVRIVPLYWICTLVEAALLWSSRRDQATGQITIDELIRSLFFIPYFNAGKMRPVLGVGWSLNFEMLFYAVFALALLLPLRRGVTAICLAFASLIVLGLMYGQGPAASDVVRGWTSPILMEFLVGVGLGAGFGALRERWTPPRLPVLPIAAGLILAEAIYLHFGTPGAGDGLAWRPVYWLFATTVVGVALLARQTDGAGLGSRLMLLLGEASYAIYLTHPITVALLMKVMSLAHIRGALWFLLVPGGVVASICAGVGVHLWLERPLTRRLRWRGRDHGAGLAPANP